MFTVISHIPSDDPNCPGIEAGPAGATRREAIEAWKEMRISAYEQNGERDPDWDSDQPDRFESMIYDIAFEMLSKNETPLPLYVNCHDEQAYLIEFPTMPSVATDGTTVRRTHIRFNLTDEEALHLCDVLEVGRDEEAEEHLSQLPFDICDTIRPAIHNSIDGRDLLIEFSSSPTQTA